MKVVLTTINKYKYYIFMNKILPDVDIYFFSGTGNTLLAVNAFAETLVKKGFNVRLLSLEKSNPNQIDTSRLIGLAFPVAMATYPFVWDFIEGMPKGNQTKVFMLATMAGFSMGLVGHLKNVLKKKGYVPIGRLQVMMPLNIFYVFSQETSSWIIKRGLKSVRRFADKIAEGKASWLATPILSEIAFYLYRFVIMFWKYKWHQQLFILKVDSEKCNNCKLCSALCPVNNIENSTHPIFGLKCQYCMRCVSYCPKQAIRSCFLYKNRSYKATKSPY